MVKPLCSDLSIKGGCKECERREECERLREKDMIRLSDFRLDQAGCERN